MSELNNTEAKKEITAEEKQKSENYATCKAIAKELEQYYNGELFKCEECGEIVKPTENENGGKVCSECGGVIDDGDQLNLYDYFNDDIYNIDYVINSDKTFKGVILMVACGGPNIYIDTFRQLVRLHWWGSYADFPIYHEICDEIDAIFEEQYRIDFGLI